MPGKAIQSLNTTNRQNRCEPATQSHGTLWVSRVAGRLPKAPAAHVPEPEMNEPNTSPPTADRRARTCPSCGTDLDLTGVGSDEVLECPNCRLVMFDRRR